MQNALINVNERDLGNGSVQTVNARDLHEFLEVGKDFSTWLKDRIEQYGFNAGSDFVTFENLSSPKSGSAKARPQRVIEYALTLDMAKELAMVERNEKGKQARQYFIECERKAKETTVDPMKLLNDPAALRGLLSNYSEKFEKLQSQVQALEPKAAALALISDANGAMSITAAAKALQIDKRCDLFKWLDTNGWIYRRAGNSVWYPYQEKLRLGYMSLKVFDTVRSDGSNRLIEQALFTPKGLARLAEIFGCEPVAA